MSANALADAAVAQLRVARNVAPAAPAETNNAAALDNAISALATYIPAEAMALYLAVASSLPAIQQTFHSIDATHVYWVFVFVCSPGLFLLAYFAKLAKQDAPLPKFWEFPWFRLMSCVIAFSVWGLCVPGGPFKSGDQAGAGVLYGILATVVSIVLPSAEAIWNWLLGMFSGTQVVNMGSAGNAAAAAQPTGAPSAAGTVQPAAPAPPKQP